MVSGLDIAGRVSAKMSWRDFDDRNGIKGIMTAAKVDVGNTGLEPGIFEREEAPLKAALHSVLYYVNTSLIHHQSTQGELTLGILRFLQCRVLVGKDAELIATTDDVSSHIFARVSILHPRMRRLPASPHPKRDNDNGKRRVRPGNGEQEVDSHLHSNCDHLDQ